MPTILIPFFDTVPDTSGYMIAGFAVIYGVMAIYLVSLAVRRRNLLRDLKTFEELDGEE